ncbi:MAG: DUF1992 domain-containing protein [Myxococcota bacterium]
MTERKPAHMTFDSWIEAQIERARRRGDFDDLPGRGQPLENLDAASDPAWWGKELLRREGVSVLPPALEIRRKAEALRDAIPSFRTEEDVRTAVELLNEEIRALNSHVPGGPPTTQAPLEVEALVRSWRAAREDG